jgi:hypothetical protein
MPEKKKVKLCGKGLIPADIGDGMQAIRGYFGFAARRSLRAGRRFQISMKGNDTLRFLAR